MIDSRTLSLSVCLLLAGISFPAAAAQAPPKPAPPPPAPAAEPPPPATEIYLLTLRTEGDKASLGAPQRITERAGYDNQPTFLADSRGVLYTAITGNQADIYLYNLADGSRQQLTNTPESEYSPTLIPGDDSGFSVVRVEADGKQRLWRVPLAGGAPELLLADAEPVGYHAWSTDGRQLALFILGEPPTLQLASRLGGERRELAQNIGRTLRRMPSGEIAFVHKLAAEEWWITAADLETGKLRRLVRTRQGQEDFAMAPTGDVWMAEGSVLYRRQPKTDVWQTVDDLSTYALRDVTRLAVSPDGKWLALVAAE